MTMWGKQITALDNKILAVYSHAFDEALAQGLGPVQCVAFAAQKAKPLHDKLRQAEKLAETIEQLESTVKTLKAQIEVLLTY